MRVSVPGRVNLIGEHIDYHNRAVLPMAIQRRICIDYKGLDDGLVRAGSASYGVVEVALEGELKPGLAGDWSNYIKAAVQAVRGRWKVLQGIEATVTSDLPAAAGLSSSSALLTGFTIALLRANGIEPTVAELMEVLPDGEQFVGTRGGGMDHAAVLGSKQGCALLVEFAPLRLIDVPIPNRWSFVVAHSLKTAEKSGALREEFNSRRVAGQNAMDKLRSGIELTAAEKRVYRHVESETRRVHDAVEAMRRGDKELFGSLLWESHKSLRDDLRVSCAELDELVEVAMKNGAFGARLTGAGFGGCAIVFCDVDDKERMARALGEKFLMFAEPSSGALSL